MVKDLNGEPIGWFKDYRNADFVIRVQQENLELQAEIEQLKIDLEQKAA